MDKDGRHMTPILQLSDFDRLLIVYTASTTTNHWKTFCSIFRVMWFLAQLVSLSKSCQMLSA